ncbi:SRPBCC domain-containing protein [Williamsia phyllosphaerae]|uniref:ATPase n=1 Tax=Williamsia phyllosphaerae TaxID=885042 RepID=A0ABQ1UWJ8_9NOCA|nr:SRPBCC domain-containing protein [Williamsia phyllosphaerae]GGF28499.1 ATPase [Williamsia phyllosphaerae]
MTTPTDERFVARRTLPATADHIFAALADPDRHQDTEPRDWVRDAVDPSPISGTGHVFAVNMYLEAVGGSYVMHNLVTEFDPGRKIAWMPGQLTDDGKHDPGGWVWRYELAPQDSGTEVTLTYDWSGTPRAIRDEIGGLPPFPAEFLDESLAALERAVTTDP